MFEKTAAGSFLPLKEIVKQIKGKLFVPVGLVADEEQQITGISSLEKARESDLTFLADRKYLQSISASKAKIIIVREPLVDLAKVQILHPHPQLAMAKLSQIFNKLTHSFSGISQKASIDPSAQIGRDVTIYDFAFVGPHTTIDDGAVIYPHVYIGAKARIGAETVIFPNVVIMDSCEIGARCIIHAGAVIGGDGFGFVPTADTLEKVPQVGVVVLEDDVEIGALCSIDRATFNETRIRQGAKLDSHVHVGHNVDVGSQTMLCAHVAIGGGAKIGNRCIASGLTGIAPGIELCDGSMFGGHSGVYQSVTQPQEYYGSPAVAAKQWMKQNAALTRLPELIKRVSHLEKLLRKEE